MENKMSKCHCGSTYKDSIRTDVVEEGICAGIWWTCPEPCGSTHVIRKKKKQTMVSRREPHVVKVLLLLVAVIFTGCSTAGYNNFMAGYQQGRNMGLGNVGYAAAGGTPQRVNNSTNQTSDWEKQKNHCMNQAAAEGLDYSHCAY